MQFNLAHISLLLLFISTCLCSFELDGNAVSNGNVDWGSLYDGTSTFGVFSGVISDPGTTSVFRTGGSKDTNDVSAWRYTDAAVPDKNNLLHAYSAARVENNQLLIYFGTDRYANDGDSAIGFWFFRQNVGLRADGSFNGVHENGDILITFDFGSTTEGFVFQWLNGVVVPVVSTTSVICNPNLQQDLCIIRNNQTVNSPWPYTAKDGTLNQFPPSSFVEGFINVNKVLNITALECFASFMSMSRSSTSLTAQLKDFVVAHFGLCDISLTSSCYNATTNDDQTEFIYSYVITATNTGLGTLGNVNIYYPANVLVAHTNSLSAGQTLVYQGTFLSSNPNQMVNSSYVTAVIDQNNVLNVSSPSGVCPVPVFGTEIMILAECNSTSINDDQTLFLHDYFILIENTGFGTMHLLSLNLTTSQDTIFIFDLSNEFLAPSEAIQLEGTLALPTRVEFFSVLVTAFDFMGTFRYDSLVLIMCPDLSLSSSINITKQCNVALVQSGNHVEIQVNFNGSVCNNGDLHLHNITVTDDLGTLSTSDDMTISLGTLLSDQCISYSGNYRPALASYAYSDTVSVTGAPSFNYPSVSDSTTAFCSVCA